MAVWPLLVVADDDDVVFPVRGFVCCPGQPGTCMVGWPLLVVGEDDDDVFLVRGCVC